MNIQTTRARRSVLTSREQTPSIRELVASAADIVGPVWPLRSVIAVNPLQGLEQLPFEQAVLEAERFRTANNDNQTGREAVNRELIKWCAAYFDEGQATISMPRGNLGFYGAFADLARYDARLNRSGSADALLRSLPCEPDEAIESTLDHLQIPVHQREDFLRQSLAALPGWAGYVKWKQYWQSPKEHAKRPASLVDYLAVRLVLTCLLWPDACVAEVEDTPLPAWLTQLPDREAQFRDALIQQLQPRSRSLRSVITRPDAQLVFCIDVRSEPFRRAIEAQGAYETLGFAGSFGLPVKVQGYDEEHPHDSCPALVTPRHLVCDHTTAQPDEPCVRKHDLGRWLLQKPAAFSHWLQYRFSTPFVLAQILGPWLGLRMLARTFAPTLVSRLANALRSLVMPPVPTEPCLSTIPPTQQADYGESALRLMGLTTNLAPLVVLCGHGSRSTSNAYATALDCGACGGNHGGQNARILAAILNSPSVRAILADRGLVIPTDTQFIAAEHNTTIDEVELYLPAGLCEERQQRLNQLRDDLAKARMMNATARVATFGPPISSGSMAIQETERRSNDWAQVRPEWGLSRNAAMIIGSRDLTRDCNLDGRCFLHSYDWKSDPTGKSLTAILTAPMVVGQWINCQYLFSTLDNTAYGSGSKITQNIAGKVGVMQGNASDLMHGLPLQSVFAADGEPYHEPLRLLTIVHAPRSTLTTIIHSQDALKKLFGNGWVTLACIDPVDHQVSLLTRDLKWQTAC